MNLWFVLVFICDLCFYASKVIYEYVCIHARFPSFSDSNQILRMYLVLTITITFNGDIRDFGIPAATRHVSKTDDGQTITGDLYHPYEALPSDYTDMAVKFYTNTMNTVPYVELKASPLKLLQGHNVFGFESYWTWCISHAWHVLWSIS